MNRSVFSKHLFYISLALLMTTLVSSDLKAQASNIGINGFFSVGSAQQGSTFQAAIVMEIPTGLHINANKPLGKYAVPTIIKIDAPQGLRITPVSYPRGVVRTFRFGGAAEERLAVYEGRTIFRFNVSVPANFGLGAANIRVIVQYQSSNDQIAFPAATRELTIPINITDRSKPMKKVNQQYFGGGRRK